MKFLFLCTLILSIAFFMASAQADGQDPPRHPRGDEAQPPREHHHGRRSVSDDKVPPKGEAGCCG